MDEEKFLQKEMGKRLSLLRHVNSLTQSDLAKKLSCSQRYVSDWECGRKWMPIRYILKMSDLFGISISHFNPKEDPKIHQETMEK